ncbi:hypothetical protein IFM89_011516 [Coptis chinensis]|uniref:CSC1-like protein RXW8 n=1 Tax=Coptis chinensis TaxID=261450 RepID=A0A835M2B6_9MAGN|nr:hypothetical protein IFM89_011516 [Coptis chinensis]
MKTKMNVAALLTSAGINIGLCIILLSLYSILRKQPGNVSVYFGRRFFQERKGSNDPFCFERLIPSASWLVKAWTTSEEEILAIGGLDAVVFLRLVVFSIRIFTIAAVFCMLLVLPLNYYGKEMIHKKIHSESLEVFTIANVMEGSKWLWAHCLALYVISLSACILLYCEYKSIAKMRLAHITRSGSSPNHFAILVRSIPWSPEETYSDSVKKFFTNYHASSYLSHQMVYRSGTVQKLMTDAEKMYKKLADYKPTSVHRLCEPCLIRCNFCGGTTSSFKILTNDPEHVEKPNLDRLDSDKREKCPPASSGYGLALFPKVCNGPGFCNNASSKFIWTKVSVGCTCLHCNITGALGSLASTPEELSTLKSRVFLVPLECAAAFVFFKTRYAAFVAAQVLQTSNPMLWVTDLAPEPRDVYWSNLWIPYKQLWIRKIATLLAATVFMLFFLAPVTFVQGLSQLDKLQKYFPILKGILKKKYISHLVTGYLPSVVLMLFLYAVPPTMMLFSAVEGTVSRSGRKKSACCKVLYFTIWNVFFVSVLSGSAISKLNAISSPKDMPTLLATAVPAQATFYITYVLTSGWASLSFEVIQLFALLCNLFSRFVLWNKEGPSNFALSFPYHTEVTKLLLFGLLGLTCSILAPLILPFLLLYFLLGYIVYRNQFLNVYITKYESGGQFWPIVHNTTIFSLVLAQIIALGVFGVKHSPVASGFTIPLVLLTLLFNEYCRQRFYPIFKCISAQDLIEMDRRDERSGRMEDIYEQLQSAYCQFSLISSEMCKGEVSNPCQVINDTQAPSEVNPHLAHPTLDKVPSSGIGQEDPWLSMAITSQEKIQSK